MAALILTLSTAINSGTLTGLIIKMTSIVFQWNKREEYFNDKANWLLPQKNECDCVNNGYSYANGNRNFKFKNINRQINEQINDLVTRL
jgi:hypothetical protein